MVVWYGYGINMASTAKVTFTLDSATINRLNDAATRLSKAKSEVVREAIAEYHERIGRVSESERRRRVRIYEEFLRRTPLRPESEMAAELKAIRDARRSGGRKHRAEDL